MALRDTDLGNAPLHAPAGQKPRRIILDFTDLIGHLARGGGVSGIPRVVFEFGNAASALARDQNIDLRFGFFDQSLDAYLQLEPPASAAGGTGRTLDWLLSEPMFRRGQDRLIDLSNIKRKYAERPIRRQLHVPYARFRLARRRLAGHLLRALKPRTEFNEIQFRSGDVLLMLGSGWSAAPTLDHIEPLQEAGIVSSVVLIHDLIPFLHLDDDSIPAAIFEPWLDRVAQMRCRFLTVSEATKTDLSNYLAGKKIDTTPIHVTRLPHEFSVPTPKALEPEIQALMSENYALFVGPISGRKNAKRLLEAWAKALARVGRDSMPTLVITSGRGAEDIYETHIRPIQSHVRLLRRPGDFALSELYRHAAFTIFPSLHEGWGLPVGESLWHGRPCITSNRSSMPEVGGSLCDYVDPTSVDNIAEAVERFALDRAYRDSRAAAIGRAKLRNWMDFGRDVLEAASLSRDQFEVRNNPAANCYTQGIAAAAAYGA